MLKASFFIEVSKMNGEEIEELVAKKRALDEQIAEIKAAQRADAISQCVALIKHHDLTERDLFRSSAKSEPKATVAPKYRNPLTGETWSGRGRAPKWINGDREAFAV
jgi:DNA-binding protein H-NS